MVLSEVVLDSTHSSWISLVARNLLGRILLSANTAWNRLKNVPWSNYFLLCWYARKLYFFFLILYNFSYAHLALLLIDLRSSTSNEMSLVLGKNKSLIRKVKANLIFLKKYC